MPIGTPVGNLDIANATLRTSNLETQNIKIGSIFVNSYPGLETTANVGNSMSNTIQFTNTHTAFTTTGNVTVGKELTVTGNVTTTSNIEVTGFVGSSGTGALTVPSGTTAQQPSTGLVGGMIRYNTTRSSLETYTTDWLPLTIGAYGLYTFTSHTFTNAGATGRTGPTITDLTDGLDAYTPDWTDNVNYLNVSTQGIQEWTVPKTGTYTITAIGAQGGSGLEGSTIHAGGKGAWMQGDFALTKGDTLHILVGQQGIGGPTPLNGYANMGGGGGGGTFVSKGTTLANSVALIVAGGGGGGTYLISSGNPNPVSNPGLSTIGSNANAGAANPSNPSPPDYEGAGFTGDAVTGGSNAAKAFKSGGVGGLGYANPNSNYHGGFGGGGGGSYSYPSGGGGGGYQGGAAGLNQWTTLGNGGGGLSYNDGTNTSGVSDSSLAVGHGSVIILKL